MSFLNVAWSWPDYFKSISGIGDYNEALTKAFDIISLVLWIILGIVGAVGAIYAIMLGIQLARAEDQGKRDDAKKHLVTVLIAVAVTLLLIIFFTTLLPAILSAFSTSVKKDAEGTGNLINPLLNLLR